MLKLDDIKKVTGGDFLNRIVKNVSIKGVSIDSRTIKKGEIFVAIIGEKQDGHQYLDQAIEKGAVAVIVSRKIKLKKEIPALFVKDTTHALGQIASFYRDQFSIPIIAITGSSGKTTTKEMLASVLSAKFKVLKNYKSFNNQYGVPLTLLQLREKHDVVVLEVGTNRPGDIESLAKIVKPTVVVFTNIGESHLERLKNKAGVFKEKMNLVKYMAKKGTIFINEDDSYLRQIRQKKISQRIVNYSVREGSCCQAKNIQHQDLNVFFHVGKQRFCLHSPAEHNVYNALAAIGVGRLFKIPFNDMSLRIKKFQLTIGRQEIFKTGGLLVVNDTYNANPVSMRSAVKTLSSISTKGKKILVLADMLELGGKSKILHESIGREIAESSANLLITTGTFARCICQGLRKKNAKIMNFHCPDLQDVHKLLKEYCQKGDVVLVKGSRGMKMERTVQFLKDTFR